MIDQLVILNLRHEARAKMPAVLNGLEWQTCLRRILFLNRFENSGLIEAAERDLLVSSSVEVYRGREAFGFLLEVICGLNSPLLGETAVMGQFKEFCSHARFPNTPWGWFLRQLTANVLVDTKRVRRDHLQGIGSQSYGSLVRQHGCFGKARARQCLLPVLRRKQRGLLLQVGIGAREPTLALA